MTAKVPFFRHGLGAPELDAVARVLAGPILIRFFHANALGMRYERLAAVVRESGATVLGAADACTA